MNVMNRSIVNSVSLSAILYTYTHVYHIKYYFLRNVFPFFCYMAKIRKVSGLSKHFYMNARVERTYRTLIGRRWLI